MPQLTLTIASRLDAVPLLGHMVHALCLYAGFSPPQANEVEVCLIEAANNSIKHAYGGDPLHSVAVDVSVSATELIFDIWDSGKSAELSRVHQDHGRSLALDPDHPEDFPESGRGLAIIQQLMDSFEYTPGRERNRFRLTKRLK